MIMDKIKGMSAVARCILFTVPIAFCFMTMLYLDNIINSSFGYNYISSVFSGNFKEFYNSAEWSYGITIYTIYAIWSIPVWIVNHMFGISDNMTAVPVLLWYKLLLVLFAVWSVYIVGKIAECLDFDKKREIQFQYASSCLFVFPVFALPQCDIIGLCFVLMGILSYLKEENRKFIIYFAIAITMKYFALFVFIPLVLYRYRRLNKLVGVLVAGAVLTVISMVLITHSAQGSTQMANDQYYINAHIRRLNAVSLRLSSDIVIGLLAFFYTALCVLAYVVPNNASRECRAKYALWLSLAGYMSFFLFYDANFYWQVLLTPFFILVSYSNMKNCKISLLLELAYSTAIILKYVYINNWVIMGGKTFSYLILKDWKPERGENLVQRVLNVTTRPLDGYMPIIQGIAYASAIMMLVINYPGIKIQSAETEEELEQDVRIVAWLRIAAVYAWILMAILGLNINQDGQLSFFR